jgi:hypothetical protein
MASVHKLQSSVQLNPLFRQINISLTKKIMFVRYKEYV